MDLKEATRKAADNVKRTTRCPEHGEQPDYQLKFADGKAGAVWTCCCNKLEENVVKKFEDELTNEVGNYIQNSLQNIFKS